MTSMTREEFIEKANRENWDKSYLKGMLKVVDSAAKKGFEFPYDFILPPPPTPIAYQPSNY